jgi:phage protein D
MVTRMSLLTPAYRLTIGGKVVDTTDEPKASTVLALTVAVDADTPADGLVLVLGRANGLDPARDDKVTVELGYADDGALVQVMAGSVTTVEPGLTATRVLAHSGAASLLRAVADQTYEDKTAGAIVRDLAAKAKVAVAAAEDGTTFPAYVIDSRRSAHRHMLDLAELCGFDLYLDTQGRLVFERFAGGKTVHVYEHAKHLVELELLRSPPRADVVEAWGEGPGGGRGGNAWAWLTKDFGPSRGTAGSGAVKLLLERPALRTAPAAATAAQAALTTLSRRATRGRLVGVGRPEVKLGDAIRLQGVPGSGVDGSYQVRGVTHHVARSGGFTTTVEFRAST